MSIVSKAFYRQSAVVFVLLTVTFFAIWYMRRIAIVIQKGVSVF